MATIRSQAVTADDIADLLDMHPMSNGTLIRYEDTGEVDTVARLTLSDISWCNYRREYEVLIDAASLRQVWEMAQDDRSDALTDQDLEAMAAYVNDPES